MDTTFNSRTNNNSSRQAFSSSESRRRFNDGRFQGNFNFNSGNISQNNKFSLLLKLVFGLLLELRQQSVSPQSQQPTTQAPQQPVEPQPQEPLTQVPQQPVELQPQEPVIQVPQQAVDPQVPVTLTPAQPTVVEPVVIQSDLINLSQKTQGIISALFSQSAENNYRVSVEDTNSDNKLGMNDTVVYRDKQGRAISSHTLTKDDIYNIRFRENMIKNAENISDKGWSFDHHGLAKIKNSHLSFPQTRIYTDVNQRLAFETVIERNDYWETTLRNGRRTLVQREFDDNGRPIRSSDAIKDLASHPQDYEFDCSTPMPILALMSIMDVIGEDDFNQQVSPINLSGWFDKYDQTQNDGGYNVSLREASAGDISINGHANLEGEYAYFDTSKGDRLIPGSGYYFDLPGDTETSYQGWNAVYLGRSDDDGYLFWTADIGTQNIHFKEDSWIPLNSRFKDHYLSAYTASPDVSRLISWDRTNKLA